jgi:hypothetical protein
MKVSHFDFDFRAIRRSAMYNNIKQIKVDDTINIKGTSAPHLPGHNPKAQYWWHAKNSKALHWHVFSEQPNCPELQ